MREIFESPTHACSRRLLGYVIRGPEATSFMSAPNPPVLEIHPGLVLKGSLSAVKDVVLTGKFEGELQTLGRLTVASGAIATGSINAGSLVLEPGNLVEARIQVAPPPKSAFKIAEQATRKAGGLWSRIKSVFRKK
jgi:hypothetical protein